MIWLVRGGGCDDVDADTIIWLVGCGGGDDDDDMTSGLWWWL